MKNSKLITDTASGMEQMEKKRRKNLWDKYNNWLIEFEMPQQWCNKAQEKYECVTNKWTFTKKAS